jgi:membrane protein YdbS with pleckstrin-like domain
MELKKEGKHLDKRGQVNPLNIGLVMVFGVISVIIVANTYAGANKTNISSTAQTVLALFDVILAVVILAVVVRGR